MSTKVLAVDVSNGLEIGNQDVVGMTEPRDSVKIVDVAAALVFRERKVLITQRCDHSHLAGLWEFPGGKRERGETFELCLARELREELGIEVEVGDLFDSITHSYPEKTVQLRFFLCRWKRNEPQALGCKAFRWVTAEEMVLFQFPAADALLLDKLKGQGWVWDRDL